MPNYVGNILIINAEQNRVNEVLNLIKNEKENMAIDFEKIIPMPAELHIDECSTGDYGLAVIKKQNNEDMSIYEEELVKNFNNMCLESKDEALELGQKYYDNLKKYGYKTWYDWSRDNWGTKWNAMNTELMDSDSIYFETAWNGVEPLICALSEKFPDVEFEYKYADEDTGYNCGEGSVQNGEIDMYYPDGGSTEAYEIAFEIRPYLEEEYELVEGKYEYIDSDEEE